MQLNLVLAPGNFAFRSSCSRDQRPCRPGPARTGTTRRASGSSSRTTAARMSTRGILRARIPFNRALNRTPDEARWIGEAWTIWTLWEGFLRSILLSREHRGVPTYSRSSRHCARDPQVFVHRNNLEGCEALNKGDKVDYDAVYDDRTRSGEKPPGELYVIPWKGPWCGHQSTEPDALELIHRTTTCRPSQDKSM